MVRHVRMTVGAINVTVDPHDAEIYKNLFLDLVDLRKSAPYFGDQRIMITSVVERSIYGELALVGIFGRFTEIDPDLSWFNARLLREATEDDINSIDIPEDLKPNYSAMFFAFFPGRHKIIFEQKHRGQTISPLYLVKSLRNLLSDENLLKKYGPVSVNIIVSAEGIDAILDLKIISRLEISVEKPNPELPEDLEAQFLDQMRQVNARKKTIIYNGNGKEGLRVDNGIRAEMNLAQNNGEIEAKGINSEGLPETRKSIDHPQKWTIAYPGELVTELQAIDRAAAEAVGLGETGGG